MNSSTLQVVIQDLIAGDFSVSTHAVKRMQQRTVTKNDIREAARTYFSAHVQADGKASITGFDLDGEELQVIAAYDNGTVVVTVYWEVIYEKKSN